MIQFLLELSFVMAMFSLGMFVIMKLVKAIRHCHFCGEYATVKKLRFCSCGYFTCKDCGNTSDHNEIHRRLSGERYDQTHG